MLDRYSHVPLYIQLKEEISKKIKRGIWAVDTQIPTEKELMDEYSIGRATVREGISILVNEGYLYKTKGVGTFVARKEPNLGFEPLISLAFSLKARGIREKNVIKNKEIVKPDKKLLAQLKWKNAQECFYLKRVRYAQNLPIAIEQSYFKADFAKGSESYDLTGSIAKILVEDLKINIKRVSQEIISRVPTDTEMEELEVSKDSRVLCMERWIYLEGEDEAYYYLKFIIPDNIYNFPIENL